MSQTDDVEGQASEWDALLAIMAHGLLTPLSVIRGYADLMLRTEGSLDDDQRRLYLTRIMENADFVSLTLTDMARGLPAGATQMLEELDARSMKRYLPAEPG